MKALPFRFLTLCWECIQSWQCTVRKRTLVKRSYGGFSTICSRKFVMVPMRYQKFVDDQSAVIERKVSKISHFHRNKPIASCINVTLRSQGCWVPWWPGFLSCLFRPNSGYFEVVLWVLAWSWGALHAFESVAMLIEITVETRYTHGLLVTIEFRGVGK